MNPSSIKMPRKERFPTPQTPFGMTDTGFFSKLLEVAAYIRHLGEGAGRKQENQKQAHHGEQTTSPFHAIQSLMTNLHPL
jgi:hypothetical protein